MNLATAARDLLESLDDGSAGDVRRVTLEVSADGRTELVTVTLQPDGGLLVVASNGDATGPHVRAALELLGGVYEQRHLEGAGPSIAPKPSVPNAQAELAAAVDDLLLAVVRHGVEEAYGTASVDEAIDGVLEAVGKPVPHGISRFVGRLRAQLSVHDVHTVARMLDGASRLVQNLRAEDEDGNKEARRHVAGWIGRATDLDLPRATIHEKTFVEVGREWVAGVERHALQRRYLLDIETGEVFREERNRSGTSSVGPCPRQVVVGLAEAQQGPVPRRLRPLQYAVGIDLSSELWDQVASVAARSVEDLGPRYRSELKAFPALAEPVAIVQVQRLDVGRGVLVTPAGDTLALRFGPGVGERLGTLIEDRAARWVFGKLLDAPEGQLELEPLSAGLDVDGITAFERLV